MSLLLIPAVWMLARIASARNGERIASVTTDAKFFVVLAFIGFVCPTVNASCLPRDGDDIYNRCASGPRCGFVGLVVLICRPRLTSFGGPTCGPPDLLEIQHRDLLGLSVVACS
jgi:hypothetical protein